MVFDRIPRVVEDNAIYAARFDDAEVTQVLADFDQFWEALAPREQARVLELLVERVEYDGQRGRISLTFHPAGIKSLTHELAKHREEAA